MSRMNGKKTHTHTQYDGGFLPDIILLTQCYYHRGTRLNAMEEVLALQPTSMIPPKRFDIFSAVWDAQKVYICPDFSLKNQAEKRRRKNEAMWHQKIKTPGGYNLTPCVANQLWRANQHEHACYGICSPRSFPTRSGILLFAVVQPWLSMQRSISP